MSRASELTAATDAGVRALAAEILQRPEYARYRSTSAEVWRKVIETIAEWIDRLPELYVEAPGLYWLLVCALGGSALLLLAHIVWTLTAALRSPPPERMLAAGRLGVDFAAEAAKLAERSAFLEASHQLLLATLAHAAQVRLLELRPEDSNRRVCEKLRGARMAPALRERLIALIQATEATWFGARGESRELYQAWQTAYTELRRSVT